MTYLNCSRCGLSIRGRYALIDPTYCPRCLARARVAQPLFRSSLSVLELTDGLAPPPGATAATGARGAPDV